MKQSIQAASIVSVETVIAVFSAGLFLQFVTSMGP